MECREAERLVQQYIDDKLPPKKMEAFISHVKKCPSCYEELETYFIIHHAVKYLDEDRHDSYNMKEMLSEDLKKKEKLITFNNWMKVAVVYVGIVLVILIVVFICISLSPDMLESGLLSNIV